MSRRLKIARFDMKITLLNGLKLFRFRIVAEQVEVGNQLIVKSGGHQLNASVPINIGDRQAGDMAFEVKKAVVVIRQDDSIHDRFGARLIAGQHLQRNTFWTFVFDDLDFSAVVQQVARCGGQHHSLICFKPGADSISNVRIDDGDQRGQREDAHQNQSDSFHEKMLASSRGEGNKAVLALRVFTVPTKRMEEFGFISVLVELDNARVISPMAKNLGTHDQG